ncbi:hypothetical protein GTW37_05035 [Streptomyces sp. SID4931]|nr:hypothetical protein [Streptomyces sp. SID4931]SCF69090.1 hypothetical protein GA0115255_1030011 [Streptomyces sp. Ncost-T6T-2b]
MGAEESIESSVEGGTEETSVTQGDEHHVLLSADTNGDGKPDAWVTDTTGDGTADLYQFDTTGDGKVDVTVMEGEETAGWTPVQRVLEGCRQPKDWTPEGDAVTAARRMQAARFGDGTAATA